MCVETLTGVLFWSFDLLGNFRAASFPFETSSGSLFRVLRWLRGAARGVVRRQHAAGLAGFPAEPRAHCPEYRDAIL